MSTAEIRTVVLLLGIGLSAYGAFVLADDLWVALGGGPYERAAAITLATITWLWTCWVMCAAGKQGKTHHASQASRDTR